MALLPNRPARTNVFQLCLWNSCSIYRRWIGSNGSGRPVVDNGGCQVSQKPFVGLDGLGRHGRFSPCHTLSIKGLEGFRHRHGGALQTRPWRNFNRVSATPLKKFTNRIQGQCDGCQHKCLPEMDGFKASYHQSNGQFSQPLKQNNHRNRPSKYRCKEAQIL